MEEEAKRAPLDREATSKRVYGEEGEERRGPRGDRVTRGFGSSRRARLEIESAAAARLP